MLDSTPRTLPYLRSHGDRFAGVVIAMVLLLALGGVVYRDRADRRAFHARHRPAAEEYCRTNPRAHVKYALADGTDPAPGVSDFEFCVLAELDRVDPK